MDVEKGEKHEVVLPRDVDASMGGEVPVAVPARELPRRGVGGRALTSLVLGIFSLMCFGIVAGIPAIVLGYMELRDIKRGVSDPSGQLVATVGLALGIVATFLTCLVILAYVLVLMLGVLPGGHEQLISI